MAKKHSILVVDDEDSLRTVLSSELINEGYEVRTAPDGDDAIQEMGKALFDLVLLDIKMPRMNGFEVLKHIKEQSRKDQGRDAHRICGPEERHRVQETWRR